MLSGEKSRNNRTVNFCPLYQPQMNTSFVSGETLIESPRLEGPDGFFVFGDFAVARFLSEIFLLFPSENDARKFALQDQRVRNLTRLNRFQQNALVDISSQMERDVDKLVSADYRITLVDVLTWATITAVGLNDEWSIDNREGQLVSNPILRKWVSFWNAVDAFHTVLGIRLLSM